MAIKMLTLLRRLSSKIIPKPTAAVPQAPNRESTWSKSQRPREDAVMSPRFEQTVMERQPRPLAAIDLIANEPVRKVVGNRAFCDGGGGALGHPKVYLNLDMGVPVVCGYCGIRYQSDHGHHH